MLPLFIIYVQLWNDFAREIAEFLLDIYYYQAVEPFRAPPQFHFLAG